MGYYTAETFRHQSLTLCIVFGECCDRTIEADLDKITDYDKQLEISHRNLVGRFKCPNHNVRNTGIRITAPSIAKNLEV